MAALVVLLSAWSLNLWFGWLNSNNHANSPCLLRGPSHKQMLEIPAQDWLCHLDEDQHLAWMLSPRMFPWLPVAPQQQQDSEELWGSWTWGVFSPLHLPGRLSTPRAAQRSSTPGPL